MNLEELLQEINSHGFKWGLYFLRDEHNTVKLVAYKSHKSGFQGGRAKRTVIKKMGPITAMPNLAFLVLREIRAITKAQRIAHSVEI